MKTNSNTIAQNFNTNVKLLIHLEKTAEKSIINTFKHGDVLACFALV